MSEFFTGVTFQQQKVTPSDDAAIRRAVLADSILSGCALSYAGSTLTMGAGMLLGCGRQFRHTSVQNWAVTGATSGYARLVLTLDMSKASTKDTFNQVVDSIEYASSLNGFLQLQQDDINEAGTIYQMEICVVSLGAGGITGIVSRLGFNPRIPTAEELGAVTIKRLWQNASPDSSFPEQNLTVGSLEKCEWIVIGAKTATDNNILSWYWFRRIDGYWKMETNSQTDAGKWARAFIRTMIYSSAAPNVLTFKNAIGVGAFDSDAAEVNNKFLVPIEIYGVTGGV